MRPTPEADGPTPGGSRELLRLAVPLVVSQSFMTVQVLLDTLLLARHDPREMAATLPAMLWFWLPFGLLQATAGYASTFVAQYTGAGRPSRVGPAVWQGIHFALASGVLFLLVSPVAPYLASVGDHSELRRARVFLNRAGGPNIMKGYRGADWGRYTGDVVYFDTVTQEFGIVSSDRYIRTYFIPSRMAHGYPTSYEYFLSQY